MPHLIEPLYDLSQQDCLNELRQTHRFLCNKVRNQWEKRYRGAIADPDYWGCKIKRIRIELREESTHNLIEIVNQVATLERLIDALKWTSGLGSGLEAFHVQCCHPTTSSSAGDNDLVLVGRGRATAHFEVSDVASKKDSNRKEKKDLNSLGMPELNRRIFLVVSSEWKEWLSKRKPPPNIVYVPIPYDGDTGIFEIRKFDQIRHGE